MSSLPERLAHWEGSPPPELFGDPIWRLPAYRIALFLVDIVRGDVSILARRSAPSHTYSQLERAVDSIGVNIAEGYSRFSGRERARYFEIALGSAREAREWYRRCSRWLGASEALDRALLLTRVIKILTVAVPRERAGASETRMRKWAKASGLASEERQPPSSSSSKQHQFQQAAISNPPVSPNRPAPRPPLHEAFHEVDPAEPGEGGRPGARNALRGGREVG